MGGRTRGPPSGSSGRGGSAGGPGGDHAAGVESASSSSPPMVTSRIEPADHAGPADDHAQAGVNGNGHGASPSSAAAAAPLSGAAAPVERDVHRSAQRRMSELATGRAAGGARRPKAGSHMKPPKDLPPVPPPVADEQARLLQDLRRLEAARERLAAGGGGAPPSMEAWAAAVGLPLPAFKVRRRAGRPVLPWGKCGQGQGGGRAILLPKGSAPAICMTAARDLIPLVSSLSSSRPLGMSRMGDS